MSCGSSKGFESELLEVDVKKYPTDYHSLILRFDNDQRGSTIRQTAHMMNIVVVAWRQILIHITSVVWIQIDGNLPLELLDLLPVLDAEMRNKVKRITFRNYWGNVTQWKCSLCVLFSNLVSVELSSRSDDSGLDLQTCKNKNVEVYRPSTRLVADNVDT